MESPEKNRSAVRNLAKAALQECEEKFRILLATMQDGVTIHDKFKIIDANQGYAAMFGYELHEIIGRDVLEFAKPQSRDLILDKLLKRNETPFKIIALRKDGSTFAAELCSRIIPHRGTRLNLTLFRKLSESIPTDHEREALEKHLGTFFDYAPDAYCLADATGKFIDANKAAEELFGHEKQDIIGKSFLKLNLLSADQIRKAAKHLAINIFGKPTEPEEYVIRHKDGRQIPVEISTVPVRLNGKTLLLSIARDSSEKKKSADALRRAVGEIEILVEERRAIEQKEARARNKKRA